jgi:hypothetical protein
MEQFFVGNGINDKVCVGCSILDVDLLGANDETVQVSIHDCSTHTPKFRYQLIMTRINQYVYNIKIEDELPEGTISLRATE